METPTTDDLVPESPERLAEKKKESGNHLYKSKDYKGALCMYEAAIKLCPENEAYYSNRSACYMMLGMYQKALEDAQKTVAHTYQTLAKRVIRLAKCYIALGDISGADQAISSASELGGKDCASNERQDLDSLRQLYDDALRAMETGDYRRVIAYIDRCMKYSPSSTKFKLIKAECLALIGCCQEAQKIANDSLQFDSLDTDAIYVRGLCFYFENEDEQAFKHFQQVLRLTPDHKKAMETYKKAKQLKQKKEKGNEAFKMGRWQQALQLYNEALTIDKNNKKVNSKLYFYKATVFSKLNQVKEAAEACSAALELDEHFVKALLQRAKYYTELGNYEEAVKDYEKLCKIDKNEEYKQSLHNAKIALEKSKSTDYYKIFGFEKTASEDYIKKPYRLAEEKNESGNHLYKTKDYKGALCMYEAAIKLCPENAAYYGNRSLCYMMLEMYQKALEDAQKAIALDPTFTKGYIQMAKCYIALGDISGAEQAISSASELGGKDCASKERQDLDSLRQLYDDALRAMETGDYRRVIAYIDCCMKYSPSSTKFKLVKAECLALIGCYQEAQEIANDSLRFDSLDIEAIYVRGLCFYFEDKDEQALKHFKQVLRLAPDHKKAVERYKKAKQLKQKKEEGNEAFKMGRWQQALQLYNEALTVDKNNKKVNATLYFNKATVCSKLNQVKEAAEACSAALELDEHFVKALLQRANYYAELDNYEEAVKDYEKLCKIDKNEEYKQLLHKAKIALEIFGFEKTANYIKKPYRLAEEKNESGNHLYKTKDYKGALCMYEAAIKLCPENAAYYGSRSLCYMMLEMYQKALEDAQKAIALDPTFTKGYIQMAKCYIALGDISGAEQAISSASELGGKDCASNERQDLDSLRQLYDDALRAMETGDYRRVIAYIDRCMKYSPSSTKFKLIKAECLALIGCYQEAQKIANDSLRFDSLDTEAIYVRGLCFYFEDKYEQALKHFEEVLSLAPDHKKAMETYKKAKELKQKKEEAEACSAALELDEHYVKALLRLAKGYTKLGNHQEAVKKYEELYKINKNEEYKQLLNEAKIALDKSKTTDYYKILGIEKTASGGDIKKAYRKCALVHHLDHYVCGPHTECREQKRCFKRVTEAYEVLSNPKKRARYDHDQDHEDSSRAG